MWEYPSGGGPLGPPPPGPPLPIIIPAGACRGLDGSNLPGYVKFSSFPASRVPPSPPPSRRGNQLGTVCPLSTSTTIGRPSMRIPSADRYALFISSSCSYSTKAYPRLLGSSSWPPPPPPLDFFSRMSLRSFTCLLYTSPSPRDVEESRMPSSA